MTFLLSLTTALSNLRANKMRSALTMLGVIIGVSSVIVMVGIVEGARASVVTEFQRLGSQLIFITYQLSRSEERTSTRRLEGLTMADVDAIREECDQIRTASAELGMGGGVVMRYRDREARGNPTGVQPDYGTIRNFTASRGRFLSADDEAEWAKVCLIGDQVRGQLFPEEDPLGKEIGIYGVNFVVVGVLEKKGSNEDDRMVLVPITTVQKRLIGRSQVSMVYAQPVNSQDVAGAMEQVWECLMRRYDNAPGFRVDSQESILNAIGRILTVFGLLLGGVAGLALLVGGIGIMNIMLVSVTERTREIGIRKAVGAKRRDILIQFLIESATVSGVGGLIGIGLGAGVANLIGLVTRIYHFGGSPGGAPGLTIHLPSWAILGAFLFSAGVGITFGIYPAMRAARLDPIEALRHE